MESQELISLRQRVTELEQHSILSRAVIDFSPHGICVHDITGRILSANERYCQMVGFTEEELTRMTVRDVDVQATPEMVDSTNQTLKQQGACQFESQHRCKNGNILDVDILIHCLDEGRTQLIAFVRDITPRKQSERALHDAQMLTHALFNAITETVFAIDVTGKVIAANETAAQRFQETVASFVGSNIRHLAPEVVPKELQTQRWNAIQEVIRLKTALRFVAERHRRFYDTCFYPVLDEQDMVTHVMIYAHDITEQKSAQDALQEYHRQMAKAEHLASTGTLSAMAAHELAQPLTVARLCTQNALAALAGRGDLSHVVQDLEDSLDGIQRTEDVVKRFRNFARMTPDIKMTQIHMLALAQRVFRLMQERCAQARLEVQFEGLSSLPTFRWYEEDMKQLFYIFVENALQATEGVSPRQLQIQGTLENRQLQLQFSDNCGGIPPAHEPKIFEPFFTSKSPDKNTGLGLCVAQRMVEDRGGRIHFENRPGQGVSFFLTIPLDDEA
jgi:PAS domain S-box-containing protein